MKAILLLLLLAGCVNTESLKPESKLLGLWKLESRVCLKVDVTPPYDITMEFKQDSVMVFTYFGGQATYTYYIREYNGERYLVVAGIGYVLMPQLEPTFFTLDDGCTELYKKI